MKPYFVAANWKMNGSQRLVSEIIEAVQGVKSDSVDIGLFLPSPYMAVAASVAGQTMIVGAQHVSQHESGAFTGEVSCAMLRDIGVSAALIGHSERRQYFGETDDLCGQRLMTVLRHGIAPVLCVGETLEERKQGVVETVIAAQLEAIDTSIEYANPAINFTIAYEPVWAIGTGEQASPDEAGEVHAFIRSQVVERWPELTPSLRVLYGGSVKADNVRAFAQQPQIDGVLVGGASLDVVTFTEICEEVAAVAQEA